MRRSRLPKFGQKMMEFISYDFLQYEVLIKLHPQRPQNPVLGSRSDFCAGAEFEARFSGCRPAGAKNLFSICFLRNPFLVSTSRTWGHGLGPIYKGPGGLGSDPFKRGPPYFPQKGK